MERSMSGISGSLSAVFLSAVCLFHAGCSGVQEASPVRIPFVDTKAESKVSERLTAAPPRSVAVLPFSSIKKVKSEKDQVDGREILRSTFYNYFRALPFYGVDIKTVDEKLADNGLTDIEEINKAAPEKLGNLLGVDAVIYGDIKSAVNFTGGIYSVTELSGVLTMKDAKSGDTLWNVKHFVKSTGGVIGQSSELVSIIESQVENAKTNFAYVSCAEDFSRDVIATLPKVKFLADTPPAIEKVELEPKGKSVFGLFDTLQVAIAGDSGLKGSFDIGSVKEGIPLLEVSPGIYKGTYIVNRGDYAKDAAIAGKLTDLRNGMQNVMALADTVTIAARPPSRPRGVTFKIGEAREVTLAWDPPETGDVKGYEIYRAADYGFDYKPAGRTEGHSFTDNSGGTAAAAMFFYQIIAYDANDNKSEPSEPVKIEIPSASSGQAVTR